MNKPKLSKQILSADCSLNEIASCQWYIGNNGLNKRIVDSTLSPYRRSSINYTTNKVRVVKNAPIITCGRRGSNDVNTLNYSFIADSLML